MTDNLDQLAGQMETLFRQAVPLANAEVDESAEERKGGAGDIGARQQQHPSRA